MDGSTGCPTFPSHTGHRQKSRTAPGSLPRNTRSSTKPPASARTSRRRRATNGNREQLHDYVLFAANTGLRPDEAWRLQFRDVTIVEDEASGQTILEIEVRGKRGVGYCKSMPGAVRPFERLKARLRPPRADHAAKDEQRSKLDCERLRRMAPAGTDRPHLSEMAARAVQDDPGRGKSQGRSRRPAPNGLQPAAHIHLSAPDGRR